jgi:hypothetical protein
MKKEIEEIIIGMVDCGPVAASMMAEKIMAVVSKGNQLEIMAATILASIVNTSASPRAAIYDAVRLATDLRVALRGV